MGVFTEKERGALIVSIIVLTIVFGLNDNSLIFVFSNWFYNLVRILIVVAISLLVKEYTKKLVAGKFSCATDYKIWNISRFWFTESAKFPLKLFGREIKSIKSIPTGIVLPLIVSLFSYGALYLPTVGVTDVEVEYHKRVGRKFINLTDLENAFIILSGAMANLLVALIAAIFGLEQFVTVNIWLTLFSFLPLSDLDGTKIFFGSSTLWVLGLVFSLAVFGLLPYLTILTSIITALVIAIFITFVYYYALEYK